jgi:hypothetical protein
MSRDLTFLIRTHHLYPARIVNPESDELQSVADSTPDLVAVFAYPASEYK